MCSAIVQPFIACVLLLDCPYIFFFQVCVGINLQEYVYCHCIALYCLYIASVLPSYIPFVFKVCIARMKVGMGMRMAYPPPIRPTKSENLNTQYRPKNDIFEQQCSTQNTQYIPNYENLTEFTIHRTPNPIQIQFKFTLHNKPTQFIMYVQHQVVEHCFYRCFYCGMCHCTLSIFSLGYPFLATESLASFVGLA